LSPTHALVSVLMALGVTCLILPAIMAARLQLKLLVILVRVAVALLAVHVRVGAVLRAQHVKRGCQLHAQHVKSAAVTVVKRARRLFQKVAAAALLNLAPAACARLVFVVATFAILVHLMFAPRQYLKVV